MIKPAPVVRCPTCGYHLAEPLPRRCPECGWRVDLSRLFGQRVAPLPTFTAPVILTGVVGGPILFLVLGGVLALGGSSAPLAVTFPYAHLLLRILPPDAAALGACVGLLQGPLYGFVLGLSLPVFQHRTTWSVVVALHAMFAAIALCLGGS